MRPGRVEPGQRVRRMPVCDGVVDWIAAAGRAWSRELLCVAQRAPAARAERCRSLADGHLH